MWVLCGGYVCVLCVLVIEWVGSWVGVMWGLCLCILCVLMIGWVGG